MRYSADFRQALQIIEKYKNTDAIPLNNRLTEYFEFMQFACLIAKVNIRNIQTT